MFIKEALFYGKKFLAESNSSFLDTILFLQKITGLEKEKILLDSNKIKLDKNMTQKFLFMLEQRKKNMPVQYIINQSEFMGIKFYVDENVLIPRCDTEILVETILKFISHNKKKYRILELCTGSGCISISLKKFCDNILISAIDIDPKAITIARKNADSNGVKIKFICADIFKMFCNEFAQNFDIVISNPPYIKTCEIKNLKDNVKKYEPMLALDGGDDGLKFYKFILENIGHSCDIFFEIGFDQANDIKKILIKNNFCKIKVFKDLAGLDRVISTRKNIYIKRE